MNKTTITDEHMAAVWKLLNEHEIESEGCYYKGHRYAFVRDADGNVIAINHVADADDANVTIAIGDAE